MDVYLRSQGLYRKRVAKDGSCLFRAVAEQVLHSQSLHLEVRKSCIKYLRKNRSQFEAFIEGSFDEYLKSLENPQEWVGQVEISALSLMFKKEFVVYQEPNVAPARITDNGFSEKIILCFSNGNHYDIIYPIGFVDNAAWCQSIIYELLYEKVFGVSVTKHLSQIRVLGEEEVCNSSASGSDDDDNVAGNNNLNQKFADMNGFKSQENGKLLQSKEGVSVLPVAVLHALNPAVYRNVEYDVWTRSRRDQQKLDFSIAACMQYSVGDKCKVCLDSSGTFYNAHIQELVAENGPAVVFVEELGERHDVPLKNLKPVPLAESSKDAWNTVSARKIRKSSVGGAVVQFEKDNRGQKSSAKPVKAQTTPSLQMQQATGSKQYILPSSQNPSAESKGRSRTPPKMSGRKQDWERREESSYYKRENIHFGLTPEERREKQVLEESKSLYEMQNMDTEAFPALSASTSDTIASGSEMKKNSALSREKNARRKSEEDQRTKDPNNINDWTDKATSYIKFCEDMLIQTRTYRKQENNKPWFKRTIKALRAKKEEAHKNGNLPEYRRLRNKLSKEIKAAKRLYSTRLEKKFSSANPKALWNGLRHITNFKGSSPSITPNKELAEELNNFYSRFEPDTSASGTHPTNPLPCVGSTPRPECPSKLDFDVSDIRKLLMSLNPRKASGPDGISTTCLKVCAEQIAPVLTDIFRSSLEVGIVPSCLKSSLIIPVPKSSSASDLNDFRPIALTPVVMKIFEQLIMSFLKEATACEVEKENLLVTSEAAVVVHDVPALSTPADQQKSTTVPSQPPAMIVWSESIPAPMPACPGTGSDCTMLHPQVTSLSPLPVPAPAVSQPLLPLSQTLSPYQDPLYPGFPVNEKGERITSPPPYSYCKNGSDLPNDKSILHFFYNLGLKAYTCPMWPPHAYLNPLHQAYFNVCRMYPNIHVYPQNNWMKEVPVNQDEGNPSVYVQQTEIRNNVQASRPVNLCSPVPLTPSVQATEIAGLLSSEPHNLEEKKNLLSEVHEFEGTQTSTMAFSHHPLGQGPYLGPPPVISPLFSQMWYGYPYQGYMESPIVQHNIFIPPQDRSVPISILPGSVTESIVVERAAIQPQELATTCKPDTPSFIATVAVEESDLNTLLVKDQENNRSEVMYQKSSKVSDVPVTRTTILEEKQSKENERNPVTTINQPEDKMRVKEESSEDEPEVSHMFTGRSKNFYNQSYGIGRSRNERFYQPNRGGYQYYRNEEGWRGARGREDGYSHTRSLRGRPSRRRPFREPYRPHNE
ncbi:OTU domain-containing protein 4 [Gastrophryne carolinensis]